MLMEIQVTGKAISVGTENPLRGRSRPPGDRSTSFQVKCSYAERSARRVERGSWRMERGERRG